MGRALSLSLSFALTGILLFTGVRAQGGCAPPQTLDAEERAFMTLLNNYRTANGLSALAESPALNRAAAWMATDLATHTYFSHTSSDGRSPRERAIDCGYPSGAGENLAGGYTSAQAVFDAWRESPGHNANMLTPGYRVVGIAREFGGTYGVYWATDFGFVADAPPSAHRRYLPLVSKEQ